MGSPCSARQNTRVCSQGSRGLFDPGFLDHRQVLEAAAEGRLSGPCRLSPDRERAAVLGRPVVGIGALVRLARDILHDVFPAPAVARAPGIRSRAPPGLKALGGGPARAASVVASLGAPPM